MRFLDDDNEDLNFYLSYVLPNEKEFHSELRGIFNLKDSAFKHTLQEEWLRNSVSLIEREVTSDIYKMPMIHREKNWQVKMKLVEEVKTSPLIQKIFDLRKKYVNQVPELERLFLKSVHDGDDQ
jgi:hypothetical protein